MSNHVMSCFKCTPKLAPTLDKANRNFFWGSEASSPPVAWKDICKPKAVGGLGVRLASYFNNAALAKLVWKTLKEPDNWWVELVRKKYLRNCSLFTTKKRQNNSKAWNSILDSREVVLKVMDCWEW